MRRFVTWMTAILGFAGVFIALATDDGWLCVLTFPYLIAWLLLTREDGDFL